LHNHNAQSVLGSTGRWPVGLGSLPRPIAEFITPAVCELIPDVAGKLPATAGWQPALPRGPQSLRARIAGRRLSRESYSSPLPFFGRFGNFIET
jgi:hypothetical protein